MLLPMEPITKPSMRDDQKKRKRRSGCSTFAVLALGIGVGVTLALLTGLLLYSFGALPIIEVQTVGTACAPAPDFATICMACASVAAPTPAPTETPTVTPTSTPDLMATATAACSTFQSQFPGTPCP